jgi:SCY1-like protein 1
LLKSFEFGGGGGKVFTIILSIAEKVSDEDFERDIQPVIIRMFSSQERGVRMCLLENLNRVIERLNPKIVNDKVFPNMVTLLKVNAYYS